MMDYAIQDGKLVFTVDQEDRKLLAQFKQEAGDNWESDGVMYDIFEPVICNSELDWLSSTDTGDLTEAPLLGVLAPRPVRERQGACVFTGFDPVGPLYYPIVGRWAFMDYERMSPQEKLLRDGVCVFTGG
jgi:hypothetical protein